MALVLNSMMVVIMYCAVIASDLGSDGKHTSVDHHLRSHVPFTGAVI